jgi:lipopolysaccharide export system protein LptA
MSEPSSCRVPAREPLNKFAQVARGLLPSLLLVAGLILPGVGEARRDDRSQPMNIDADRSESSARGAGVSVLSGNVRISQGTMKVEADRAEIHQDDGQIVKVVLEGRPVTFEQELDDDQGMLHARALRVDYDTALDSLLLTGEVHIRQPRGELTSDRVEYSLESGRITSGGEGEGRVRLRIEPTQGRQGDTP